ncbi:MAG: hypothetical protein AAF772_21005 [Acidobacteriota bacterium]
MRSTRGQAPPQARGRPARPRDAAPPTTAGQRPTNLRGRGSAPSPPADHPGARSRGTRPDSASNPPRPTARPGRAPARPPTGSTPANVGSRSGAHRPKPNTPNIGSRSGTHRPKPPRETPAGARGQGRAPARPPTGSTPSTAGSRSGAHRPKPSRETPSPIGSDPRAGRDQAARRRRIGGNIHLTRYSGSNAFYPLAVDLDFHPAGWRGRLEHPDGSLSTPGTAVLVDDAWYEMVEFRQHPESGRYHGYLQPWSDSETMRNIVELTPERCEALTSQHDHQEERAERAQELERWAPLLGLLPMAEQLRMERDYGTPAVRNTIFSVPPLLLLGGVGMLVAIAYHLGIRFGPLEPVAALLDHLQLLLIYLVTESLLRLAIAGYGRRPVGSLMVILPLAIHQLVTNQRSQWRSRNHELIRQLENNPAHLADLRDTVKPLPDAQEAAFEVISLMPKDHWTLNVTGIRYCDRIYLATERFTKDRDDGLTWHHFHLTPAPAERVLRVYRDYDPREVQQLYRDHRRQESAAWIETFAPIWGLLDGTLQKRLAASYRYAPAAMTQISIVAMLAIGALFGLLGGINLRQAEYVSGSLLLLLGIALLIDGIQRRLKYHSGEVIGSRLFGRLVRPMVLRALRWETRAKGSAKPDPPPHTARASS